MAMIRPPPPSIVLGLGGIGRSHRSTAAVAFNVNNVRQLSSAPSTNRRSNANKSNSSNDNDNGEPWWSLSSLHKRVATAIATSLPDESLSAVHKSLSEKLNEANSHKSVSINEAIVSARAREESMQVQMQQRHQSQSQSHQLLEKEMEQRAYEKAQERMQLELQAMKEQLKRKEAERIRKEREEVETMKREHEREVAFERWKENAAKERQQEEKENQQQQQQVGVQSDRVEDSHDTMQQQPQSHHHPILGLQIAHLPYKRIHLTSASTLASLPVYEKQRAYRHDRAKVMAKDKKKTLWMGIPGVISLLEEDDGRLSILDGQHRVGMMALLEEEQRKLCEKKQQGDEGNMNGSSSSNVSVHEEELAELDLNNILVEVFFPQQIDDGDNNNNENDKAATIFTEINKAQPIKLLDLPGMANKRTLAIIDRAASHFHDAHPAMFSSSQKCRAPHLNLDNLRDALFGSDVIEREKMGSGGDLIQWMVDRNEDLKSQYGEDEHNGNVDVERRLESGKRVNETALKKARKHDFYLGLESTWLYK